MTRTTKAALEAENADLRAKLASQGKALNGAMAHDVGSLREELAAALKAGREQKRLARERKRMLKAAREEIRTLKGIAPKGPKAAVEVAKPAPKGPKKAAKPAKKTVPVPPAAAPEPATLDAILAAIGSLAGRIVALEVQA